MLHFLHNVIRLFKICKHVIENVLNFNSREQLVTIDCELMGKYNVKFESFDSIKCSPIKFITFVCPEYNIKSFELKDVGNSYWKNDSNISEAIDWILLKNNITLDNIVTRKNTINDIKSRLLTTIVLRFKTLHNLWSWYFTINGYNFDDSYFEYKPKNFWESKENLISEIKKYCEHKCEQSITPYLINEDIEGLYDWYINNFNIGKLKKNKLNNSKIYSKNNYRLLTLAYPEILDKKLLFAWEGESTQVNNWSRLDFRNESLQELIKYRLCPNSNNLVSDIPRCLNECFLKGTIFYKFVQVSKKCYKTQIFYKWACDAFPEYYKLWNESDFSSAVVADDGSKMDSNEEVKCYEFMKNNYLLIIKSTGQRRSMEYAFKFNDTHYIPDFIITHFNNLILRKPIIVEYFGLFTNKPSNKWISDYQDKIVSKNTFYNSLVDYLYLDIYPFDLKNNCDGIKNKLNNLLEKQLLKEVV